MVIKVSLYQFLRFFFKTNLTTRRFTGKFSGMSITLATCGALSDNFAKVNHFHFILRRRVIVQLARSGSKNELMQNARIKQTSAAQQVDANLAERVNAAGVRLPFH
jgi:hypothetical protein